jgi:hypothetical protein
MKIRRAPNSKASAIITAVFPAPVGKLISARSFDTLK